MEKSFCEIRLQDFQEIPKLEYLRTTYIANCVFNSFLCYTAIMLNIVTIHAIRRTSSLPKTLTTLLLSLAVSDVGVGLVVQPFHISILVTKLQQNIPNCRTSKISLVSTYFLAIASFLGVVAVSVDRFLAIHLHLRYQELVTHKRVVAVVIFIWMLSAFLSLSSLWFQFETYLVVITFGVIGLVLTTLVYIRIYFTVRRHKIQIQALQVQQEAQTSEMANFASLVKSAVGVFYVYLLFLACYLPYFISSAAIKIDGPSIALKRFSLFSSTLVYLNSSLNPVIYCWKMRHIRRAIMDTLRNMPWLRNCAWCSS